MNNMQFCDLTLQQVFRIPLLQEDMASGANLF
jgi:hypothetical protein